MKKGMIWLSVLLSVVAAGVLLPWADNRAALAQEDAVVRFYLFYGESCPHCHEVIDNHLPTIEDKYGDQVEYELVEVWTDVDAYLTLLGLETKLGVPEDLQGSVPVLVIGDKVLIGARDIPDNLETHIDEYLAQGGVDYPSLDDLPEVVLPTPEPAVQVLVFFDPNGTHAEALNSFFVALGQEYGNQLEVYAADVTQQENADILAQIDETLGVDPPDAGTPQILVDRRILVGMGEIEEQLPGLVEQYLAEGGSSLPTLEELVAAGPPTTGTPSPETSEPVGTEDAVEPGDKPIHLAYFYETGCQECERAQYDLNYIQQNYPQVEVVEFNIGENQALAEWLGERLDVPEEERLESPAIFVGGDHLAPDEMILRNIEAAVVKYVTTGAEPTWEAFGQEEQQAAEQTLVERYKSLGALTVLGAGLVNGLNPCAFVTIVFFLSYLAFMGRGGRDVLIVGAMFTLGVFVAYLLAGLGLSQLMEPLAGLQTALKRWVFSVTALLCLLLAAVSLHDYIKARQGKTDEMKIKLSMDLRRRVNKVIREGAQMRGFYLVAFGVGAIVSLIQLTCTSPIYVGIVFLIHDVPEMQSNALLYLLLYNLAYIVPLVVIFLLAHFGTSSEQLGGFITARTATIKLLTVVVFLVLAGWLIYTLLPLFGLA
jgi:cytochrome c biogenesis protein CcdA/thiol-disulfide isomerase/thioredoxin